MHSAPAVNYPVGRSHFFAYFIGLTGLLGLVVGLMLCFQSPMVTVFQALYGLLFLSSFVFAMTVWRHSVTGHLQWDGQAWCWVEQEVALHVALTLHFDAQSLMIITLRTDANRVIWIWPERTFDASRWIALRRAVHSSAGLNHVIATHVSVESSRS